MLRQTTAPTRNLRNHVAFVLPRHELEAVAVARRESMERVDDQVEEHLREAPFVCEDLRGLCEPTNDCRAPSQLSRRHLQRKLEGGLDRYEIARVVVTMHEGPQPFDDRTNALHALVGLTDPLTQLHP